ncbi:OmpA family protein [Salinivibrio kushneri]|uniref:OmpA family protein n=1 Tax=Salinivibrio kushneri TaxID=1908198 RepID=UPI0022B30FA4|nr:OmpA family protein [Salinivibrio kushneri]WBA13255.1 OmpA family protein [Salinivibrio kushneri]
MKVLGLSLILVLITGCTVAISPPPTATQSHDVTDSDQDGVINARDRCDNTPRGAVIDNQGCPNYIQPTAARQSPTASARQIDVYFASNTAKVTTAAITNIDAMADFLMDYPGTTLRLTGHASAGGSASYNHALSYRRAMTVKRALIDRGITPQRIDVVAKGETDAKHGSGTADAYRRVSGEVLNFKGDVEKAWTIFTRRPQS